MTQAAQLYDRDYAKHYRAFDERLATDRGFAVFSPWLGSLCRSFGRPIDVLDLGCGTGRYFASLTGVRELVGLDASADMLEQARAPIDAARVTAGRVTLVRGDAATHAFEPGRFDLIYSVGVLGEHIPLTANLIRRVAGWLAPSGRLAFTAVHPESETVAPTWKRRLGRAAMPFAVGPLDRWLHERWCSHGLYADERRVSEVLAAARLAPVSIERVQSVHLHCLVVAKKSASE